MERTEREIQRGFIINTSAHYLLACFMLLCFPYMNRFFQLFRGVSVSFVHYFERKNALPLTLPPLFQKYIHFYLLDIGIILLLIITYSSVKCRFKDLAYNTYSRHLTHLSIWIFCSIGFSIFSNYFTQYVMALNLVISFIAFMIFYILFSKTNYYNRIIVYGTVFASTIQSLIGITQFIIQKSLGLYFLFEPIISPSMNNIPIFIPNNKTQAFFSLLPWVDPIQTYMIRAIGTFDHPNILGAYLATSIFFNYYAIISAKKKWLSKLCSIFLICQITALLLTFSRGPIIGWIVITFFFFFVLLMRKDLLSKSEKNRLRFLLVFLGLCFLTTFIILYQPLISRGVFNATSLSKNSNNERWTFFNLAIEMIKRSPIYGIGFNNFAIFPYSTLGSHLSSTNPVGSLSHNIYLQIAAELGFVGLIVFFCFLRRLAITTIKTRFNIFKLCLVCIFVLMLCLGLVDHYFWAYSSGRFMFFSYLALLAASNQRIQEDFVLPEKSSRALDLQKSPHLA